MTIFADLRDTLDARRARRAQRRRLERELAGYRTPSERLDLEAMIARYPHDETSEVREILAQQDLSDQVSLARSA
jgi:hypothetical protein